jgi:hypothetical protein
MTDVRISELQRLKFHKTHNIVLVSDKPQFVQLPSANPPKKPSVYLWLITKGEAQDTGEVLYVGKAGQGVARRCLQHQNGFSNSGTGRRNAAALKSILQERDVVVTVWSRKADQGEILGAKVSLYAAEEAALYVLFAPRLNRAAFPAMGEPAPAQNPGAAADIQQRPSSLTEQIARVIDAHLRLQDEGTVDDLLAQMDAYGEEARDQLARMLEVVRRHILRSEHALQLKGGYTDQVRGCNGVTTLGFGKLAAQRFAPNGWVARIYLCDDAPRIAFPRRVLNDAKMLSVDVAMDSFSPTDNEEFLREPWAFFAPGDFFT